MYNQYQAKHLPFPKNRQKMKLICQTPNKDRLLILQRPSQLGTQMDLTNEGHVLEAFFSPLASVYWRCLYGQEAEKAHAELE